MATYTLEGLEVGTRVRVKPGHHSQQIYLQSRKLDGREGKVVRKSRFGYVFVQFDKTRREKRPPVEMVQPRWLDICASPEAP